MAHPGRRIHQHSTVWFNMDRQALHFALSLNAQVEADDLVTVADAVLAGRLNCGCAHDRLNPTRVIWITCSTTCLALSRPKALNSSGSSPFRIAASMF